MKPSHLSYVHNLLYVDLYEQEKSTLIAVLATVTLDQVLLLLVIIVVIHLTYPQSLSAVGCPATCSNEAKQPTTGGYPDQGKRPPDLPALVAPGQEH